MIREALTLEMLGSLEPREAAAHFIARRAEGLTASEERLLADWLAKDQHHRRIFASADQAWRAFDEAEGDEILTAMRAFALAPRRRSWAQWPAAAAAAVLLVVAGLFFLLPRSPSGETIQYASVRGEVKELQLPDGSHMTLDADSSATGRFSDDSRMVDLQRGRAFFEVAPDTSRPFAVTAAGRRVVAVGTRFDVSLTSDGLTVTLLEGKVTVATLDGTGSPLTLTPGQQFIASSGHAKVLTIGESSENAIAWRTGLINFNDQTLAEAAAVMNRYSRDQIVISDPDIASIRLSGQFRAGESQRFAATLSELHQLRIVRKADQIELVK